MDVLISAKRLLWKPKQRQGSKAAMAMTTGAANIRKTLEGGANVPVCRRKRDGRYFPAQDLLPADLGLTCQGSEGVLSPGVLDRPVGEGFMGLYQLSVSALQIIAKFSGLKQQTQISSRSKGQEFRSNLAE